MLRTIASHAGGFISFASAMLLLSTAVKADLGTAAAVSTEPGQVWVSVATFSTDPSGDYNGGNGVYAIFARLVSYDGPGGFSGGSTTYHGADLPDDHIVIVSKINSCVEGFYSVAGSHYAASIEHGFVPLTPTYDARWVNEISCS